MTVVVLVCVPLVVITVVLSKRPASLGLRWFYLTFASVGSWLCSAASGEVGEVKSLVVLSCNHAQRLDITVVRVRQNVRLRQLS